MACPLGPLRALTVPAHSFHNRNVCQVLLEEVSLVVDEYSAGRPAKAKSGLFSFSSLLPTVPGMPGACVRGGAGDGAQLHTNCLKTRCQEVV